MTAERVIHVGISEMALATRCDEVLSTHSLGSCLGFVAYDPGACVAGMVHCLLPRAGDRRARPDFNPFMYVDSGVPAMIRAMYAKGARRGGLVFKAAGCAHMLGVNSSFDIGRTNCETLHKLLAANGQRLEAEDLGGTIPRTMHLRMNGYTVAISSTGRRWEL